MAAGVQSRERGRRNRRRPMSEINVTPFVDVMLVLLVIFMVAAPLMERGISVALPKASTSQKVNSGPGLTITLTKEHVVYFNRDVVTMKELRKALAGLPHDHPVAIRADGNAYVSRLMELWDLCRDTGFREIRILTMSE